MSVLSMIVIFISNASEALGLQRKHYCVISFIVYLQNFVVEIFIPSHRDIHWCLVVVNIKEKTFHCLDSLGAMDCCTENTDSLN